MLYCQGQGDARRGCVQRGSEGAKGHGWKAFWARNRSIKIAADCFPESRRMADMKRVLMGTVALVALGTVPAVAQQSVKIGFVSTFSGPTAVIGNDMRNSFELALDHLGRKMGGMPVEVVYEDDQQKPEVGKQKTEKVVQSDRVNFITGYIWSNVLLASLKPAVD